MARFDRKYKLGKCILLLGPQVSFDPNDPGLMPLTTSLAHYLTDNGEFSDDKDLVNPDDIAHVAQLFQQKIDRRNLEMEVKEFYATYKDLTTDFHRDMAALPFTLCINISPDNFYSNALIAAGKTPVQDYYNFRRPPRKFTPVNPTAEKPYIYYLYGHSDLYGRSDLCDHSVLYDPHNDSESLVLTEDDLLEFLVKVIKASTDLPPFILSQFADPNINFLFVGFGFHSWHNRILLHTLNALNHLNQSFAVEDQSFFKHPECRLTAVFYTRHHKIKFEQLSWLAFAKALRNAYIPIATPIVSPPQPSPENAPKVFLCYAGEDRSEVEQLSQQLQTAGIETWQDKQNLRTGDNWDRVLVKVIQEFVDYVIVVQTPALTSQIEGYFYKEIAAALDRQKKFSTKVRFILPIMLSDCNLLEELHDFHAIHLDVAGGFEQLVDAIKTDWQQRQKQAAA